MEGVALSGGTLGGRDRSEREIVTVQLDAQGSGMGGEGNGGTNGWIVMMGRDCWTT